MVEGSLFPSSPELEGRVRRLVEELLAQRTLRYAKGESSSIPVEVVQELLRSILYTLSLRLRAGDGDPLLLLESSPEQLLEQGQQEIARHLTRARRLLSLARGSAVDIPNRAYRDTLAGIGRFFTRYDPLFFAHEIPGDIDYQLCLPLSPSTLGVEYVEEYLRRLWIENRLVARLDFKEVTATLEAISPEHEELLLNVYECSLPVVVRASGMALCADSVDMIAATVCGNLHLGAQDREYLTQALLARLPYAGQIKK